MKNNKRILLFIFCVCAIQTFGQVLTIDSVLSRIESNNPMLKMYDEQINAANNYSEMAKSWMPPTFSTGPWQAPYKNFSDGMWMITRAYLLRMADLGRNTLITDSLVSA